MTSQRVRRAYWRLVHDGAWERSKSHFQWTYPLVFGAVVFVLTGLVTGFDNARDKLQPRLFIGATTVLFAIVGYGYNFFRSASDLHVQALDAVSRIEKLKDSELAAASANHVKERTGLNARVADLERELSGKQKDQALADKLTELHRFGISDLLNRPPRKHTSEAIVEWRQREREWTAEVLQVMRDHGCSGQDVHKVEMIGTFPLLERLHPIAKVARDLSMLTFRLERVQETIDKYAE